MDLNMVIMPACTEAPDRQLLETMMERTRTELIDTVRGLSETNARRRLVPSRTTPIGLIKHAAMAERRWFQYVLGGLPESECDGPITPGDPSFYVGDDETVADVIAEFQRAAERTRKIAATMHLEDTREYPEIGTISLRWSYLMLIHDFARHAGHGDILREQIEAER